MAATTAYQSSALMNSQPWMGKEGLQLFNQNPVGGNAGSMRKSTTLFPMRVCATPSIRRFYEKEHQVSLTNAYSNKDQIENSNSQYNPFSSLVKQERLGSSIEISDANRVNYEQSHESSLNTVDLPSFYDTKSSEETICPQEYDKPPKYSSPSKSSKNVKVHQKRQRLSLGRIPNFVKCFSCERSIKEDHFSEHLLFGIVRCSNCNATFEDCQNFQLWVAECDMGDTLCHHNLSYLSDPVAYIKEKLALDQTEYLENYVKKLRSLEIRTPWKQAIRKCKDYLAIQHLECSNFTDENYYTSDSTTCLIDKGERLTNETSESTRREKGGIDVARSDGSGREDTTDATALPQSHNIDQSVCGSVESGNNTYLYEPIEYSKDVIGDKFLTQSERAEEHDSDSVFGSAGCSNNDAIDVFESPTKGERIRSSSGLRIGDDEQYSSQPGCSFWEDSRYETHGIHDVTNVLQRSSSPTNNNLGSDGQKISEDTVFEDCPEFLCSEKHLEETADLFSVAEGSSTREYDEMNNLQQNIGKEKHKKNLKRQKKTMKGVSKKSCTGGKNKLKIVSVPIPVPSNDFYLVSRTAVEECPNCYEVLCPTQFKVNVLTKVMTTICDGCDLTIIIINEGINIFTDDKKEGYDVYSDNSTSNSSSKSKGKRKHLHGRYMTHPLLF